MYFKTEQNRNFNTYKLKIIKSFPKLNLSKQFKIWYI